MNRREFVRTAGGATAGVAALGAAGPAAAQEGTSTASGGEGGDGGNTAPDFGGYLDDVGNFSGPGSTVDATGQGTVTVEVGVQANGGPNGFGPPAVHVDNGATVEFDWTGNGSHNVISDGDGPLDSGSAASSSGVNYKHTFENDGVFNYYCEPHESLQMKGSIVVGTDYPTQTLESGGPVEVDPHYAGVPIQPHYVGFGAGLAVIIPLIFTFFQLKYGESPHTSGGNN